MASRGKIALLPRNIRHEINSWLECGEQPKPILRWLNALPEVQSILKSEFDGRPITKKNLSEWKAGGFVAWQRVQKTFTRFRSFSSLPGEPGPTAAELAIPAHFAAFLAAELTRQTTELLETTTDPQARQRYLCEALRQLNNMRQGERCASLAALDRFRLQIASERHHEERQNAQARRDIDKAGKPIFQATLAQLLSRNDPAAKVAGLLLKLTDTAQKARLTPPKPKVRHPDPEPKDQVRPSPG